MNGSSSNARARFFSGTAAQRQRQRQATDHLQQRGNAGVDKRVEHHPPEDRVIEIGCKILQSDKGSGVRDRPVLQAQ
jgi:hypothetical protein